MENNPKKCVLKRISMSFILAFLMIFNFHTFTIKAETNPGVQVINNCESQLVLSSGHYTITQDTTVSQGIVIHKGNIVYIEIPEGLTLTCNGKTASNLQRSVQTTFPGTSAEREVIFDYSPYLSTPGIMIEEGATLYLTGKGNVVAKGGDGAKAGDAFLNTTITYKTEITGGPLFDNNLTVVSGFGQRGGVGANAPSAGIGGSGGKGGESSDRSEADHEGTFGESSGIYSRYVVNNDGANGCKGGDGTSMGTLYVVDSVVVQSTPGANISYVGKSGYYNDRGQTHISKSHYKDHNSTLKWVVGATGGGGGSSSGAASIGGGGAGGGGGASGTSGSFYFDYYGNVSDVTFTSTYYNGQNGSSSKGGDGGLAQSVIDPNGEYLNVKVGVGGSIGTAGLGGNLYVSETATINGKKGNKLKQKDLGATTNSYSGQGANVSLITSLTVEVKKNGVKDSGHNVVLRINLKMT